MNQSFWAITLFLNLSLTATAQNNLVIIGQGEKVNFEGNTTTLNGNVLATEPVDNLSRITFEEGKMIIHRTTGNQEYAIKEVGKVSLAGNLNKLQLFYPPSISRLLNFETGTDLTLDAHYTAEHQTDDFSAQTTCDIMLQGSQVSGDATAKALMAEDGNTLILTPTQPTKFVLSGNTEERNIVVRGSQNVMILLDNANINTSSTPAITLEGASGTVAYIATKKGTANTLSGIQCTAGGALQLSGEGVLRVLAERDKEAAIRCAADITINGGTLNVFASGYAAQGIYSDTNVNITKGAINVITTGDGTQEDDNLGFDCAAAICAGNKSDKKNGVINITGGRIRIKTTGGTGASGLAAMHKIKASDAIIAIATFDDAFNAVDEIEANRCHIFTTSAVDDAVDSNGALIFRDGSFYACGPYPKESAFDNDGKNFAIEGDITLIALGAKTDKPMSSKSTRPTIFLNKIVTDRYVIISDADGKEVLAFVAPTYEGGQHVIVVSSPLLQPNTTYTVSTANSCNGGTELWGIITNGHFDSPRPITTVTSSSVK